MSEFSEVFGERLLVARFNYHHISQETLAERAAIHRTQISLLEGGRRVPLLDTFVRLAGACGVSGGELLGPMRWEPARPGTPGRFVFTEPEGS
ncbi:MAG: helix-turn-helix transcriptional regulator [Actinobacteria bacterium]|nr:helix-turn-helix transcriptional regulator [Actinomycetota bacterium]